MKTLFDNHTNQAVAGLLPSSLMTVNDDGLIALGGQLFSRASLEAYAEGMGLKPLVINACSRVEGVLVRTPRQLLLLPGLEEATEMDTTAVYDKNRELRSRIVVNQGGTRSSKTYSLCQLFIIRLLAEPNSGRVLSIARKTLPALKATVMRDFFEVLNSMGIYDSACHNRSDLTYKLFGNLVEFISMDDPQKKRGAKRDYLWLNEANEFSFEDFRQLSLRTSGQIHLDFNPSDEYHWIYDEVLTREDCFFVQSTYLDNPFLPAEIVQEIERLRRHDENYWRVFGLGERGVSQAAVYTHACTIPKLPEGGSVFYGLDFGFNKPAALVKVVLKDDEVYAEELLYKAGLTNADLIKAMKELIPRGSNEIYADAAEPQRIQEIYRAGFNIKPANKDVRKGIDTVKARALHITSHSVNLLKELRCYKYRQDLHGNILEEPVKYNDHAMDALRYAVHTYLLKPNGNYDNYIL